MEQPSFDEDNNPFLGSQVSDNDDDLLYNAVDSSPDFVPMQFESRVTDLLKNSKITIQITEAGNSNEAVNSKKYVVYTIKMINLNDSQEEILTRRRYSEFELLRLVLTKIFPLIIVPPIPPKNYVNIFKNVQTGNYINSTHLNKAKLIEHRKRLLSNFLNNCLEISQIRSLEFFSKFLDPNSNWVDEINLISSQLPKSIYLLNPENGLRTDETYGHMPVPTSRIGFLKENRLGKYIVGEDEDANVPVSPEEDELAIATPTSSYIINTSHLDELNKKIMENYVGLSNDYTELGTIFNAFSLILSDTSGVQTKTDEIKLNVLLDKLGQSFDRLFITINALIGDLEAKFSEPLGEVVQYSTILHFISRYQLKKLKQKGLLDTDLKEKRLALDELLGESKIEGITNAQPLAKNTTYDFDGTPGKGSKFKFPTMKKITQYVTDIIDQNPDQTRKQKILHLEQKIKTLEKCQGIMLEDISYIADELQKNFRVFHTKQLKMIYEILLCYNRFLIGWARKNVDIWEEVKEETQKL